MRTRGYIGIGLDNPKSNNNVGSTMRAAGCYGVSLVVTSGNRYKRGLTDPQKQYRHIPFIRGVKDLKEIVPYDCVPVAVEIIDSAESLIDYKHPERAFYIFGGEDATLGDRVLSWCRDVVYIPTNYCMNLAATVNVVLYDRLAKQIRKD